MNKYSSETDFTSIFIPRVFSNITKERITHVVETVVPLGIVERIDIVEIDEKTNRVWVHFSRWYDSEFVNEFKKLLIDGTKQAKIVYDEPWYWLVLKNTHRLANGQPKIRLDLEDGEIVTPTQVSSPKSMVTFTTSSSKKNYRERKWCDVESDTEEDSTPIVRPVSPPCPPPYPNPYQQPIMYQIPYPMYYDVPPIAPGIPFWLCQQPYLPPIAPTLSFQHPVSSWNGMPHSSDYQDDELYMFDIEDDEAFLAENDYQEIIDDLDDGEMYTDEDLYNMWLMEKEELALINQTGDSAEPVIVIDTEFDYGNVFETSGLGFDEETITFAEHCDAPLASDTRVPETPTTSPLSQRLFSAMSRPLQDIKDIKDRMYESSPLLRSLSMKSATRPIMSYKSAVVSTR